MNAKEIVRPSVRNTFFYGKIISWKFNDSLVYIKNRERYCYRVKLTFSSGKEINYQQGGFKTKSEAYKAKEYAIASLFNETFIPYDYTAKEFYDYWLYYYMIDTKEIAYNTFMSYRNIIYNYFLPVFENKLLKNLNQKDLMEALFKIKSPDILRIAYGVLSGSLNYAKSQGYISFSFADVAIKDHKALYSKISARQKRIDFNKKIADQENVYTVEQVSTLLYTYKKEEPVIYLAMLFSLTLGLRISETIAVKYENIDFFNNKLYIKNQLGRTIQNEGVPGQSLLTQEKKLKTHNSERTVPIADFVMEEIILQRKNYETLREELGSDFHDLGYIICQDNGLPYNRCFKDDHYKKVVEKCGFQYIPWRKLRTTFASVLNSHNVSLKAISLSLGHASPDFTEKVYVKKEMEVQEVALYLKDYIDEVLPAEAKIDVSFFDIDDI